MDINDFLQEIKHINWFEHNKELNEEYHVVFSVFEAYDTWNKQMLKTWDKQIFLLENIAIEQIGNSRIDEIFSLVSSEIGNIIWQRWGEFIDKWHLEYETGLDNEMMDMVKRDMSWACIERILNKQGFFNELLKIYKTGYFPCSWLGDYPNGKAVVL